MARRQNDTVDDLGRQLCEQAGRLRSLAEAVRSDGSPPDITEYVKTGRGPVYQRDNARWVRRLGVAYAFEAAAARLEEELRSLRA